MKTWKMRRNCALTPGQLLKFYIALVCLSLIVATGFLLAGVKIILIFTAIELSAVTIGFLVYCRHALDFEEIEISGTRFLVRKFIAYKETVTEFNTRWVRLSHPEEHQKVFFIEQAGQRVDVGQFLRREQFKSLIAELKHYLG
jgi:uncharacterized membrane protein